MTDSFQITHNFTEDGEITEVGAETISLGLRALIGASWTCTEVKGFHERERELPELLMLMVSELAEALESYRADEPLIWFRDRVDDTVQITDEPVEPGSDYRRKVEGVAAELADVLIRIGDWAGEKPEYADALVNAVILKNRYNATRPYRHGKRI